MLWSTMSRRKIRTQVIKIIVYILDQVEFFIIFRLFCFFFVVFWGVSFCRGCCSVGMVITVIDFCWFLGSRRQFMFSGNSVRFLEMGRGSMQYLLLGSLMKIGVCSEVCGMVMIVRISGLSGSCDTEKFGGSLVMFRYQGYFIFFWFVFICWRYIEQQVCL